MNGIIVVNKAENFTSMDCCALVRKLTGERRVGHTGTLDPNATGVLPICIGKATRLIEYMDKTSKKYIAGFRLGYKSDTEDIWGNLSKVEIDKKISSDDIKANFSIGEVYQTPPMYSAKKINGQKLYDIARQGREIERKANLINIYKLELLEFDGIDGKLEIECSRGTYVRTIIAELGDKLGTGAVMTSLVRTESSGFTLDDAVDIIEIKKMIESGLKNIDFIHPIDEAMKKYPRLDVKDDIAKLICNGNPLYKEEIAFLPGIQAVYNRDKLIAVVNEGELDKVFNENI